MGPWGASSVATDRASHRGRATETDLLRLRVAAGVAPTPAAGGGYLPPRGERAVRVATRVGAPLLEAIDAAAAADDDVQRARRAVQVASAQTRTVAGALVVAPILLVPGLGRLVGADLVTFYRTGLGLLVLAAGGALLLLGCGVIVLLVRRVGRPVRERSSGGPFAIGAAIVVAWLVWRTIGPALAPIAGLAAQHLAARRPSGSAPEAHDVEEAADLAAIALGGGVSNAHALRLAADELPELADALRRLAFDLEHGRSATSEPHELDRLALVLVSATELGAPVAPTLRRLAADLRADDLARKLAAAERLPAQLTFPTALCLLPATLLLIGAPIVHAGLAAGT